MKPAMVAIPVLLLALQVHAAESMHEHDHDGTSARKTQTAWGVPGGASNVQRTVEVRMRDTMRFDPAQITVKRGETVRFVIVNEGKLEHEFVLGTKATLDRHATEMASTSGMHMHHDEAWMADVAPGKRRVLVWTFNRDGTFMFACLVPGHYEAGMLGRITVPPAGKW